MRRATLVPFLCLLAFIGIVVWGALPRQAETPAADNVEIPGLDWAALGSWTRDYVAVKGTDGEWVGLEELLASLDAFVKAAGQSGDAESIHKEHLVKVNEGVNQWTIAETERGKLLLGALLKASEDPESWGRLLSSLGPGFMAGVYELASEWRPQLIEGMDTARTELADARGEERRKLEANLEHGKNLLATIDRIPAPTESALEQLAIIKQVFESRRAEESRRNAPTND